MKMHLSILLASIVLATAQSASGSSENSMSQGELSAVETSIAEAKIRLEVLDDQDVELSPVLTQHMADRTAIFEKYGLEKENSQISLRNLRAFRNEILTLNGETRHKVSEIMTEKQLSEWDVMQEENRRETRARFSR